MGACSRTFHIEFWVWRELDDQVQITIGTTANPRRALDDMRLQGVKTTAAYYQEILRNPEFRSGQFNTSFVESHPELTNYSIKRKPEELALAIAAAIAAHGSSLRKRTQASKVAPPQTSSDQ